MNSAKTKDIVLIGMFAAVLAVISQLHIPMPGGVPITIQVFGIALVGSFLGWKKGLIATLVYILLGAMGLPIFAGFQGGMQVMVGFAGGYIWGWPFLALLCGINLKKKYGKKGEIPEIILALIGLMIVEGLGGLWWAHLAGDQTFSAIMIYSFTAFIPKDIVITILGLYLGRYMRRLLRYND